MTTIDQQPTAVPVPGRSPRAGAVTITQYSRRAIVAIWAAAALPMGVLAWIVAPVIAGGGGVSLTQALLVCLTAGLIWQFVLVAGFTIHLLGLNLPHPVSYDIGNFLSTAAGKTMFHGSWGWFAVVVTMGIFNTVLGEELLFRGLLLPRMNGAFGDRDWVANGVLFAAYHVHIPWTIPVNLLDTLLISYPAKRFRSAWIGIAVHSAQTVFITLLVLRLVL